MSIIESSGLAHVRLTVSDIRRSKAFYNELLGWPVAIDMSDKVDEPGIKESPENFYGGVVYKMPSGALLGLRPVAPAGQVFDSATTGLDHISFAVESKAELEKAHQHFIDKEIEHGEVNELTDAGMAIMSFSDPDGIHCELSASI